MANFQHHKGAVTGLEWHQEDSTVFASSGADDQVFILVVYYCIIFGSWKENEVAGSVVFSQ